MVQLKLVRRQWFLDGFLVIIFRDNIVVCRPEFQDNIHACIFIKYANDTVGEHVPERVLVEKTLFNANERTVV